MLNKDKTNVSNGTSWLLSCPACFAVNNNLVEFCHQCNYRFAPNLNPLAIAQSEGELLGKAITVKPKLAVLVGTWVIFLPIFIIGLALAVSQALNDSGTRGFAFFWFGLIGSGISSKFLYSVTRNYLTMKERTFEKDGEILN